MKYWGVILTLCLPFMLHSQQISTTTAKSIAQQLVDSDILSEKGKTTLLWYVEPKFQDTTRRKAYQPIITKGRILSHCTWAFYDEMMHRQKHTEIELNILKTGKNTNPLDTNLFYNTSLLRKLDSTFTGLISPTRSVFGMHLMKTFEDLKKIGLINEKVNKELIEKLKKGQFKTEHDLLNFATDRTIYYQKYPKEKANQLAVLNKLQQQNKLTHQAHKTLINSYEPYKLKNTIDIVRLCKQALYIDLKTFPKEPILIYTKLFEKIKMLFPSLEFYNFDIQQNGNNLTVSFKLEDKHYQKTFAHHLKNVSTHNDDSQGIASINFDFHRLLNKALADQQFSERLYYVYHQDKQIHNPWVFAYILLEEEERNLWRDGSLSQETHKLFYTSLEIEDFITACQTIGLFSHLTSDEIEAGRQLLNGKNIESYTDLLASFDHTIAHFKKSVIAETMYEDYTNIMAKASKNQFMPKNVQYYCEESAATKCYVAFELKGKTKEIKLNITNWMDKNLVTSINKQLEEYQIDGQFYVTDGVLSTIFLSSEQYHYLLNHYPDLFGKW